MFNIRHKMLRQRFPALVLLRRYEANITAVYRAIACTWRSEVISFTYVIQIYLDPVSTMLTACLNPVREDLYTKGHHIVLFYS